MAIFANMHPFYSKILAPVIFPDAWDIFCIIIGKTCQTSGIILVCLIHLQQCIVKSQAQRIEVVDGSNESLHHPAPHFLGN